MTYSEAATLPDAYDKPFDVIVNGPVVVVLGVDAVAVSMTPEAILTSLEPLRIAAEQALENRRNGVGLNSDEDLES